MFQGELLVLGKGTKAKVWSFGLEVNHHFYKNQDHFPMLDLIGVGIDQTRLCIGEWWKVFIGALVPLKLEKCLVYQLYDGKSLILFILQNNVQNRCIYN